MKALVIGASGRVGRHLMRLLTARGDEAAGTYATRPFPGGVPLRIEDGAQVEALLRRIRPQVVFQPGSQTHVDACEERPGEARRINVEGVAHVARGCAAVGAYLVSFSTDYVFDGAEGPYAESAAPRPLSEYGRSKLAGEKAVTAPATVIRTASVYEYFPGDGNFLMFVHDRLAAGQPVSCFTDQSGTPSYGPDVAAAALAVADRRLTGIMHAAGPEAMSRHAFALKVAAAFGFDPALVVATTHRETPQRAIRPARAGLISTRLEAETGFRMRSVDEALREIRGQA